MFFVSINGLEIDFAIVKVRRLYAMVEAQSRRDLQMFL